MELIKSGGSLKIVQAGQDTIYIPSSALEIRLADGFLSIFDVEVIKASTNDYTTVTNPVATSLENLADQVTALFTAAGGGGGGGDASAANQVISNGLLTTIESNTASLVDETAFVTTAVVAAGVTFDSGVLDATGYSQVQTEILSDKDGTIQIDFCSDAGGTDIVRSLSIPYIAANGYQFFAAPAFVDYIRYRFTNDEGTDTTDFYYTTKFKTQAISPQLLTTGAFIAPSMVTTLNRSIITGQESDGVFENVSVTETTNDSGTYHNLNVVSGARPSQLAGRLKVSEVVDTSVSVLQRTITAGKTLYVTDILLTVDNTDNNVTGRINLRDGLTVAGAIILPLQIQESPTNESATVTITHTFGEPMEFSTGIFIEEGPGTSTITGVLIGYEE